MRLQILLCWLSGWLLVSALGAQTRTEMPLDGDWQLQVAGESHWRPVTVPGTFEDQVDVDFDGVAIYRKSFPAWQLQDDQRFLVHFDAAATLTRVWFNGLEVGGHQGGWTSFRLDVTDAARSRADGPWELRVQVDESVGHNTQGFLPVIAPHFGGLWQSVRLLAVPGNWIDERGVLISGDPESRNLHYRIPLHCPDPGRLSLSCRLRGDTQWMSLVRDQPLAADREARRQTITGEVDLSKLPGPPLMSWSPQHPTLYEWKIELTGHARVDSVTGLFGVRNIQTSGDHFRLNGSPVNLRGLLHWGYQPPGTAPTLWESSMRRDVQFAKQRGFNMIKFCLWVPPQRFLTICDEMGMLAWIEYPTWHPDFSAEKLSELKAEYDEFFRHDRNHPSVILRSLTCETGPSADLQVIQSLYDRCKQQIPGAIVVDDSSWIAWNRVFDFYDDHPYGNNHTWVNELQRLKRFIAERETKPLMLGEAITADTWTDPSWFVQAETGDDHWQPTFLEPTRTWLADARQRDGTRAVDHLLTDSRVSAMLMRKFQIEAFRREVPGGGYVVSVYRDMPKAAMGLIDYLGNPKWTAADWDWHTDSMVLLQTPSDRRSYFSGESLKASFVAAGLVGGNFPQNANVFLKPENAERKVLRWVAGSDTGSQRPTVDSFDPVPETREPQRHVLEFTTAGGDSPTQHRALSNRWPIWVLPLPDQPTEICVHPSASQLLDRVAGHQRAWSRNPLARGAKRARWPVIVTCVLDGQVLDLLQQGGRVVLLANNESNSFPLQPHWFLRGGPLVTELCENLVPRSMLVELQHFDLAADVIRDIQYLDAIDPLLMLWETHDLDHIKTNGLLFHMPVGETGSLFVSALRHDGETNAAGSYLLQRLVQLLDREDRREDWADAIRGEENLRQLRREIQQKKVMLDQAVWRFSPDADQQGRAGQWFLPAFDDSQWGEISIDRSWESQGYPQLDRWAWYRTRVTLPADWDGERTFLNFSGVDDYYEVFVNGQQVGSGGDREKRETAYELRVSHDITEQIRGGLPLQITVAVYDWHGAGGIFRPVWLSTQPISDQPRMLK